MNGRMAQYMKLLEDPKNWSVENAPEDIEFVKLVHKDSSLND